MIFETLIAGIKAHNKEELLAQMDKLSEKEKFLMSLIIFDGINIKELPWILGRPHDTIQEEVISALRKVSLTVCA